MVETLEERAAGRFGCIHVMDRESDFIGLLRCIEEYDARYVIRAGRNRVIENDEDATSLFDLVRELKPKAKRIIHIVADFSRS